MNRPASVVAFDLETCKLASDLPGGWKDLKAGKGGISCLVAWSSTSGRPHIFDAHTLSDAATLLESADVILSFNGISFDIPVLEGVLGRRLHLSNHLDLLAIIWKALDVTGEPHRGNRLTELADRCLGMAKSGDGALAPALMRDGRWGELMDYCLHDVHITRSLFPCPTGFRRSPCNG